MHAAIKRKNKILLTAETVIKGKKRHKKITKILLTADTAKKTNYLYSLNIQR